MPVSLLLAAAFVVSGCKSQHDHPERQTSAPSSATPTTLTSVTGAQTTGTSAIDTADGEWRMAAKDYANTRYSGLAQINTSNVSQLKVAWTFSLGNTRGEEAAPLVVNNTMYLVTPYPNIVYALDLTKPGSPLKWKFAPPVSSAAQGVACCDVVNRGMVYDAGRVYFNTLDCQTYALDAATGAKLWSTQVGDINSGETVTMAPIVARGKVLVGNSGGEMGVRGCLTAIDERSGKIAWKAFATGPDSDCLIGPNFHPFYQSDKGKNLGVKTWPPGAWMNGGGTSWGWVSYDPQLNLIYYGTGNPGPWNADQRPGDNKWTAGIFARNADNGEAVWFYQWSPHDLYDYDGVNENVLLDLPVNGQTRKVLVRPERNGYLYVLDRQTGEVLSATPYGPINTSTSVDLTTGRLIYAPDKAPKVGQVVRDIMPGSPGTKDWQPSAWSPRTGLLYIPHNNLSMDFEGIEANYIAGTPYVGANVKLTPGPGGNRGEFCAWDPVHAKKVWAIPEDLPVWSGALTTAGDLVFYGTMDGWFKAVDARTGNVLWKFKTGSGIIGQPMTYKGPDGKQYVAILSGVGGWAGAIVVGDLDARDSTAGGGFVNAVRDLPQKSSKGGALYVFALP
jgi:PQQ-dependent dehydrogenase (methanol/ethanol family)